MMKRYIMIIESSVKGTGSEKLYIDDYNRVIILEY